MSKLSEGYADVSVGLPQMMLAPERELYWLKGALPSNLSCKETCEGAELISWDPLAYRSMPITAPAPMQLL